MRTILGLVVAVILFLGFIWPGSFVGHPIWQTGPTGDLCINIDGVQTTVPVGLFRDNAGICVASPGVPGQPVQPAPGQPNVSPTRIPAVTDVAIEPDGRIWMPSFREGMSRYETSFTAPSGGNMTRRWRGINAALIDANGNTVVANANDVQITLTPGMRYTVRGGDFNGGFSLEVVR